MKNLIMILVALVTIQVTAQEHNNKSSQDRRAMYNNATPEELTQIQTRKMTKQLDLSETQQKDVYSLLLERNTLRQTKKEAFIQAKKNSERQGISKAERLKMKDERLAQQTALQDRMKTILSSEQLTTWEEHMAKRGQNQKNKGYNKRRQYNRKQN